MEVRRALALVLMLAAAGCTSVPRTEKVYVPIAATCPAPPAMPRPALPIAQLNDDSGPELVMRAYTASIAALQGYAQQLEQILGAYRAEE